MDLDISIDTYDVDLCVSNVATLHRYFNKNENYMCIKA